MIKFFRKIRHNLMSENKTGKYLKYAIGEIILVMIGILLALQVNNWNEKRIEREKIKAQYLSLITSLLEDKENLEAYLELQSFRVHSLDYVLDFIGEIHNYDEMSNALKVPFFNSFIWNKPIPDTLNTEFIEKAFSWSFRYMPFILSQKAINEFESTGMYSLIKNENLKLQINKYYSQVQWRLLQDTIDINTSRWQSEMIEGGIYLMDMTNYPNPLSLVKDNPKRIALIKYIISDANWRANNAIEFIQMIEELIQLIDKEL